MEKSSVFEEIFSTKILIAGAIIFVLMFLSFYPKFYYFPDEQHYLRNSYLLLNGSMKIFDPLKAYGYTGYEGYFVSKYFIGTSVLLLPFAAIHWEFAFIANMLLHLASFFVFVLILKELKISRIFGLLFLFFPAFVFFSRTLLSETASVFIVLLGTYFLIRKKTFSGGLAFGAGMLFRFTNALVFAPFLLLSLKETRASKKMLIGFSVFAAILILYNLAVFQTALPSYSFLEADNIFNFSNIPFKALMFATATMALYPLMLFAFIFYRGIFAREMKLAAGLLLLFYLPYYFQPFKISINDFFIGIRFWVPVMPFFLIAYARFIDDLLPKLKFSRQQFIYGAVFATIVLLAGAAAVNFQHSKLASDRFEIFKAVYSATNENSLIVSDPSTTGIAYKANDSPFNSMFFSEWFGKRNVIALSEYEKYKNGFAEIFYFKTFFEGSRLEFELKKIKG